MKRGTLGTGTVKKHFEKRGPSRLFKTLTLHKQSLRLNIGAAANGFLTVNQRYKSARLARENFEKWSRLILLEGFGEYPIDDGKPGVVASTKKIGGPARLRMDNEDDVYIKEVPRAIRQGDRVLVYGLHKSKKRKGPFMFGSDLEGEKLEPFPPAKRTLREMKEKITPQHRNALIKKINSYLGRQPQKSSRRNALTFGDLMFGYEKGIHRFLKRSSLDSPPILFYETVLTSTLKRQSSQLFQAIEEFCVPVPTDIAKELKKYLILQPSQVKVKENVAN